MAMNQELIDTVEAVLTELEDMNSGTLTFGTHSAAVAVGFGYMYERDMMDGAYNAKYDFSILARSSSIHGWNLKPKDAVGFVGNGVSGSFLIKNMENTNEVYSYIRLQQKT
jgi:hypothetical protein